MQAGRLLALDTPAGLRRQASGGEVVHVVVQGELPPAAVEELQCWTLVKSTHRSGERELRLVVDDASLAIPMLVQYFRDRDTVTESIDEYVPPFDDVFVQLVEQGEER